MKRLAGMIGLVLACSTGGCLEGEDHAPVDKIEAAPQWPADEAEAEESEEVSASPMTQHHVLGQASAPPAAAKVKAKHKRGVRFRKSALGAKGAGSGGAGRAHMLTAEPNTEAYAAVEVNGWKGVASAPLSTFSIDVDTASYSNVRRMLREGRLPVHGAVRIEEMVNYFNYDYPAPSGETPFGVDMEIGAAPWNAAHHLVRVGIKGRTIPRGQRPPSNLVFLLDVSGSMGSRDKLPLLKKAFKLLVSQLDARDTVTIAVYAGASGLALPPTKGDRKADILHALDNLHAGGGTHGAAGIRLAYEMAQRQFIDGGINRVILATDGDMNVGMTSHSELTDLVQSRAKGGVFLTVLGFGRGNLKDDTMETIADKGNGNYAYIDTVSEARKVLSTQFGGTLITIAKDVKIQVEFNPTHVAGYRLIGYENRMLANRDFNDDSKDAGELGSGHTVTALYEIVPTGTPIPGSSVDPLKYQKPSKPSAVAESDELMTVKLRYKAPQGDTSRLVTETVSRSDITARPSADFRWATAVAGFGMMLRGSPHKGDTSWASVIELATGAVGSDPSGRRMEMVVLAKQARELAKAQGN